MCLVVYLAADAPLPLVPWDAECPAFHVAPLSPEETAVAARFTKPHVVYAGSHEGCGCGFDYGQWEGEKRDEVAAARASVRALGEYLAAATAAVGPVELYACWGGDQGLEPVGRIALTPADLGGAAFWFEERTLALFSPRA